MERSLYDTFRLPASLQNKLDALLYNETSSTISRSDVLQIVKGYQDWLTVVNDQIEKTSGSIKTQISNAAGEIDKSLIQDTEALKTEINTLEERDKQQVSRRFELQTKLARLKSAKATSVSEQQFRGAELATSTLYAWSGIIAVIAILVGFIFQRAIKQGVDPTNFNFTFLLELVAVFILTATILILGLVDKIQDEALSALIGGISGYLFGRGVDARKKQSENQTTSTTPSTLVEQKLRDAMEMVSRMIENLATAQLSDPEKQLAKKYLNMLVPPVGSQLPSKANALTLLELLDPSFALLQPATSAERESLNILESLAA